MQRDRYLSVSLLNSNSPRYGSHTKLNSSHPCCGWWCKKRLSCIVLSQYVHTAFVYVSTRAGSAGGPPRKVRKSRKFSITGVDSESPALLLSLVRTTTTTVLGRGPSCRPQLILMRLQRVLHNFPAWDAELSTGRVPKVLHIQ